jgi:hypothetical protein
MAGGSASALSLSRPAQASLTLRPVGSLSHQSGLCHEAPALPVTRLSRSSATDQSTTLWVESSSTDGSRLQGARPKPDIAIAIVHRFKSHSAFPFEESSLKNAGMSTNPTPASTAGFLRRTRFVLVNDRVPRGDADCALCSSKIEKSYVRELQTRLLYCDRQCFAGHAIAIKSPARKVS